MSSPTGLVILASVIAHAFLLIFVQGRKDRVRAGRLWLMLAVTFSLLSSGAYLLRNYGSFLATLAQAGLIVAYGAVVFRDLINRVPRLWVIGGMVWIGAMVAAAAFGDASVIEDAEWLVASVRQPTLLPIITGIGLLAAPFALLLAVFYAFYAAVLPELANRALFWVTNTTILLMGTILILSGSEALVLIGQPLSLLGVAGAVYAQMTYRVLDIRRELGLALRVGVLLLITAAVVLAALLIANLLEYRNLPTLIALALLAAVVYLPARLLAEFVIDRAMHDSLTSPTEATRLYSQQIIGAVELGTLVEASTRALSAIMRVRRAALILVRDGERTVELQMLPGDGKRGILDKNGMLYRKFAEGSCVSQFDLEFDPAYRAVPDAERAFFRETGMSAYAPIAFENVLIGVLACGAKLNDAPIHARDFELLATMAHQTGTALRNARLVADLRTLNQTIEGAKEQMERLDSVKSDFITIASHELRTPLAQIRGYTEILDALNEQGDLEQDQIGDMVSSLRKAGERMEELIAAMLDTSQIDIDAMDLHFTQTTVESIVRMAIEPLSDAIKQRQITLTARGLRGLPNVHADMQRLVQAFRNVVVNAVKYTPDGGRIEIKATLQPANAPGEGEHILIAVADNGVGIEKENLELIFRKFYRGYDPNLHSTGAYKFMGAGPGLGLTIAQGVIEGHGGKIWAESPGHSMENFPGTTFYIRLPIAPPNEARRVFNFQLPEPVSKVETHMRSPG